MNSLHIPPGYTPVLDLYETQRAIGQLKRSFEDGLAAALNLCRVTCPLFVVPQSGLNDDLSGNERAVDFAIPATGGEAQIVHSLAKWKRMALHKYGFPAGQGLYTDMNAIRRDEPALDNLHSIYVDQWDWEKIITRDERSIETLKAAVNAIHGAILGTHDYIKSVYPKLTLTLPREVTFVTAQELEDIYPDLTPEAREDEYARIHGAIFIIGIGGKLKSGSRHGGRSPDYDDWTLNGDLIYWNGLLGRAMELQSMGIRVDPPALDRQLTLSGADGRRALDYHKTLLAGELPLTIGGGIGQSRLCMLLLEKAHIGEVQVSVWDEATAAGCAAAGIPLL